MVKRSDTAAPFTLLDMVRCTQAVRRRDETVIVRGGARRPVADVVADHRDEIEAMARGGSQSATYLLAAIDGEGSYK